MDLLESIKRDKAYMKYKLTVKNWEKRFKDEFSRTPSKFDIKEAPSNIKYAYKKYFQLKSSALENSLLICDDDSVASPEPIHEKFEFTLNDSDSKELLLPTLPSGKELNKMLSSSEKSNNIVLKSKFTDHLSEKLFKNRRFSLRNPRKLTLTKDISIQKTDDLLTNNAIETECIEYTDLHSTCDLVISQDTSVTNGNDSLCNNKELVSLNLPYQRNCVDAGLKENHSNVSVRQINSSWLMRASGFLCPDEELNKKTNEDTKFGLRNINMPEELESICDVVENSESEDDIAISKLKTAFKKRKIDYVAEKSESEEDDIAISKPKRALKKRKIEYLVTEDFNKNCGKSKNNDIDINMEDNNKSKQVKHNKIKDKQKKTIKKDEKPNATDNQEPPDIREYLPFGLNEVVTPRHPNLSDIIKAPDKSSIKHKQESVHEEGSKLITKIQNGTINENFIKINIEKKVFVRGKKSVNFSKYKKKLWKDKKALHSGMEFPDSGKITCFKCGFGGHMARYCTAQKENSLLPIEKYDEDNLPTLEDMQNIVNKETNNITFTEETMNTFLYEASQVPEAVLKLLAETSTSLDKVQPVFSDGQCSKELFVALNKFGHTLFRSGQEEAIKRILSGKSTLLILSTGSGKSLCYQLPAFIYRQHYKCVTLVISPLVSLMEDQVLNMPEFLKAGCLHTNQQPTQRRKVIECLKNGEISILLISPEALIAGDTTNGFTGLFKSLPPIAFACIDEAHCVSQWSHNFRPSYLMICRVLREKLNVKCILGLTATASQTTIRSIIDHINVPDGLNGVLTNPALPDNLYLSMSFEKDKDRALLSLLTSERIDSFNSVIVYCIRRNECERVAAVIRSCLSQPGKLNMEKENRKRKRMSYIAEAYHAGMSAAQRKKIQNNFMDGTLKIIVATVAFGMGINKSDIRCIIHYNMPSSFESYVQEVGRAGRDGQPAFCHVFMSNSSLDKDELLKHIHANSVDRPIIRKFLQKVFIPCNCTTPNFQPSIHPSHPILSKCKGHEVGIPIDETVEELDLPAENIATLLCYIELHHKHYIKVLNNAYTMCKISSYGGPKKILEAAKTCPPLAMAYIIESRKKQDNMNSSILEFNVIEIAAAIGWESGMTKYHLKNLEWLTVNGTSQRSHLKVEFNTLGFRIKAPGDLSASELDTMLDDVNESVYKQERVMLYQLEEIHKTFSPICYESCNVIEFSEEFVHKRSNDLKSLINQYFKRENNISESIVLSERPLDVERVSNDVRALLATYKDCKFNGRSIARIFQGISSPNYPALVWGKCKFWRAHINEDFYGIVKIATQQIIQMKM